MEVPDATVVSPDIHPSGGKGFAIRAASLVILEQAIAACVDTRAKAFRIEIGFIVSRSHAVNTGDSICLCQHGRDQR